MLVDTRVTGGVAATYVVAVLCIVGGLFGLLPNLDGRLFPAAMAPQWMMVGLLMMTVAELRMIRLAIQGRRQEEN